MSQTLREEEQVARMIARGLGHNDDTGMHWERYVLAARIVVREFRAASEGQSGEPVAYLHEITEPDGSEAKILSHGAANPWSHWMQSHLSQCKHRVTPLYAAPPQESGDGWQPINTAPLETPIMVRMETDRVEGGVWVATTILHEDAAHWTDCATILHYDGNSLVRGFRGALTGWLPLYAAPPQESAIPDGFALVPKEPTTAMIDVLAASIGSYPEAELAYRAMIEAASTPSRIRKETDHE